MKYIPLVNLKNTTGIVTTCKEEKEPIVANKNGVPALVLMLFSTLNDTQFFTLNETILG